MSSTQREYLALDRASRAEHTRASRVADAEHMARSCQRDVERPGRLGQIAREGVARSTLLARALRGDVVLDDAERERFVREQRHLATMLDQMADDSADLADRGYYTYHAAGARVTAALLEGGSDA